MFCLLVMFVYGVNTFIIFTFSTFPVSKIIIIHLFFNYLDLYKGILQVPLNLTIRMPKQPSPFPLTHTSWTYPIQEDSLINVGDVSGIRVSFSDSLRKCFIALSFLINAPLPS